ncbi:ABC transporter permease [Galactobacter valiniphilus]|uniref:ABC transporter permease n=1 Tax=Galactobacter valiniphilus TaxID=2676122 RepID=A0A399JH81_9MICC|nr:iron chelate uptake ABC transporter family permease subunit [Galactobacter valiniphilus]RII43532.1 ABC transporter permease [Galactobacter valiniphilus]
MSNTTAAPAAATEAAAGSARSGRFARPGRRGVVALCLGLGALVLLSGFSLFVGVADIDPARLLAGDPEAWDLVWISRLPRTLAAVLAGAAVAVAGLIMQQLSRNKFVDPGMVGTTESATLGILVITVAIPAAPILAKMGVATLFALAGTALFLALINRLPTRDTLLVPLVGIMLGGVVAAATTFFAYRFDLLQTLNTWMIGDLSGILRGRYELLWIVAGACVLGYIAADRFTVAGLGEDFTTNLGMNYKATVRLGMSIVAIISAVTVTTVGALPFLGLVVPNLVSLLVGDHLRRAVPLTALIGAGMVLACDILGRLIRQPYEAPIGMIMSVVGAAVFLVLLSARRRGGASARTAPKARPATVTTAEGKNA